MGPRDTAGIERYSHLFLTLGGPSGDPRGARRTLIEPAGLRGFFGLDEDPFAETDLPIRFFASPRHQQACALLRRGIEDAVSFGLLTARAGMGKKSLLNALRDSLPGDEYAAIELRAEPGFGEKFALKHLLHGLGLEWIYREEAPAHHLLSLVRNTVRATHRENGIRLALFVADAHHLTAGLWQIIQALSNIEGRRKKTVSIVLSGEDPLADALRQKSLATVWQRTFVREHIRPLDAEETGHYLQRRLEQARFPGRLFSPDTFAFMTRATGGILREIDALAHNALVRAFECRKKIIDADILASLPPGC